MFVIANDDKAKHKKRALCDMTFNIRSHVTPIFDMAGVFSKMKQMTCVTLKQMHPSLQSLQVHKFL